MADPIPPTEPAAPLAVRMVNEVETLKVLADPVRIAILRLLMRAAVHRPPVLSVKEIAAELGEPPTKLYRHVKALEASSLIVVAETRLVSGIVESRYRTGQLNLELDDQLLDAHASTGQPTMLLAAGFEEFQQAMIAGIAAGRIHFDVEPDTQEGYRRPIITIADRRLSAEKANELRARLISVIAEYTDPANEPPDGVPIRLLVGYFCEDWLSSPGDGASPNGDAVSPPADGVSPPGDG